VLLYTRAAKTVAALCRVARSALQANRSSAGTHVGPVRGARYGPT
jgi:hypothetical protein